MSDFSATQWFCRTRLKLQFLPVDLDQHKNLLPYCLNFLGFISKEQQDLEKAMEFHQPAYRGAAERRRSPGLYCHLPLVLFDMKRLPEARKDFSEALLVYQKIGDIQNQAAQLYHLGQVESESGRYPEANILKDKGYLPSENRYAGLTK